MLPPRSHEKPLHLSSIDVASGRVSCPRYLMDVSFGNRLRSQRERQQLSLTVIAERTKIKASLLEALERDDVSKWPPGIFRR